MKKCFFTLLAATMAISMSATVIPHYALELGYDHGWAHVRTPDLGYSYYFDNAHMDGFHVGGNVQLDFSQGQNIPGLLIGINYQFLANNLISQDKDRQYTSDKIKEQAKAAGATNINIYNYAFMHNLQIPVRFVYTYQFNNDWRLNVQTGPQVRLHLAFTEDINTTYKIDGKKNGTYAQTDYVSGKMFAKQWINGELNKRDNQLDELQMLSCFDMTWGFGIGFAWRSLGLNFSYDLGMINLFSKDTAKDPRFNGERWKYNSDALAVTLSYRIK